jgi:hypothetical protein
VSSARPSLRRRVSTQPGSEPRLKPRIIRGRRKSVVGRGINDRLDILARFWKAPIHDVLVWRSGNNHTLWSFRLANGCHTALSTEPWHQLAVTRTDPRFSPHDRYATSVLRIYACIVRAIPVARSWIHGYRAESVTPDASPLGIGLGTVEVSSGLTALIRSIPFVDCTTAGTVLGKILIVRPASKAASRNNIYNWDRRGRIT